MPKKFIHSLDMEIEVSFIIIYSDNLPTLNNNKQQNQIPFKRKKVISFILPQLNTVAKYCS